MAESWTLLGIPLLGRRRSGAFPEQPAPGPSLQTGPGPPAPQPPPPIFPILVKGIRVYPKELPPEFSDTLSFPWGSPSISHVSCQFAHSRSLPPQTPSFALGSHTPSNWFTHSLPGSCPHPVRGLRVLHVLCTLRGLSDTALSRTTQPCSG